MAPDPSTSDQQAADAATARSPRLWDVSIVKTFFGGSRPIDVSTLYRGIEAGRYPRPINVSGNMVRWLADECEAALHRMIDERNAGKRTMPRPGRGRPRRVR